jgi:pimeloyl-ACP methyl ester carboxylesterase
MRYRNLLTASILMAALGARPVAAETNESEGEPPEKREMPNVAAPTFGGMQLWGDERFFHQWRIQRHVLTGHYRLLDERDRRQAWGTRDECEAKLAEIRRERKLKPMSGKVVLALHGMFRTNGSMGRMRAELERDGQYQVMCVTYPSTRDGVPEHARALASIIAGLEGVEEINFVAHSLGNLVIRHYLADQTDAEKGLAPDPRIKRIVMLGPPNHAPARAKLWADNKWLSGLYHTVLSSNGHYLANGWDELAPGLATPACEFGILAGGKGDGTGWHTDLPGDDDGTVTVDETRLAGASDFLVVPIRHTFLPSDKQAIDHVRRFLDHGYFVSEASRAPIKD